MDRGLLKGIAMAYMVILVGSTITFAAANPLELKANAQVEDNCHKLPIGGVVASGEEEGNVASNALDMDPTTRWSNFGKGSYIQADLGDPTILCSVDISWLYGDSRLYEFVISISNDGVNFNDMVSTKSSGDTNSAERYQVPQVTASYVRITVYGNNENDWTNISEMAINGIQECTTPKISDVEAIGDDGNGNVPENTLDNNIGTRWSNNGFPSWIQYDLGKSQLICDIDISMYRGSLRVVSFTVSTSNDGVNFTPIFSGQSSGQTIDLERYNVPDTVARIVRVIVTGNTENSWSSINEVRINGEAAPTPPPPTECKSPQISEVSASGNDGLGNIPENTLDRDLFSRWSNNGFPSWIQYDLGKSQLICDIDISMYRGSLRLVSFTVSTSNDGVNFTPIFSGQSSGQTIDLERYNVPDTVARYVRITVTGNTENNWASISEVDINRDSGATLPPPPPPPGDLDEFGIIKIYPDGNFDVDIPFILGRQDGQSNRWNAASNEGSIRIPSPQQFVNYEVTGYIKISQSFNGFNMKLWGPHHGSLGTPFPFDNVRNQDGRLSPCCWYDLGIDSNGAVATQIEYPHPDNYDKPNPGPVQNVGTDLVNKWIGVKWIVYKIPNSDSRKVELWWDKGGIDSTGKPANQWEILVSKVDNGDWLPSDYSPPNQQEVELRIRNVAPSAIEVRHLYVRDITTA